MKILTLVSLVLRCSLVSAKTNPMGIFENHADIGNFKNAGSVQYGNATQTYTPKGAGYNISFWRDELHYAYKGIKGDFILADNFEFTGKGTDAHSQAKQKESIIAAGYYSTGDSLLMRVEDYVNAILYFEKAAAIYKENNNWSGYINCLNGIAYSYSERNEFDKSLHIAEKALALAIKRLRNSKPEEAYSYLVIGRSYLKLGDTRKALSYYERSLKILKSSSRVNQLRLAMLYMYMGGYYISEKKNEEGVHYCLISLDLLTKELGEQHVKVAVLYNNISLAYYDLGYYDIGISYLEKAIKIKEKANKRLGPSYNNLGLMYLFKSDYDIALQYFNKTLSIMDDVSGDNNRSFTYNNIGLALLYKYDNEGALTSFRRGLNLLQKKFPGKNVLFEAQIYHNMGIAYSDIFSETENKAYQDSAIMYSANALKIRESLLDKNNPLLAQSYINLGSDFFDDQQYDQASIYFQKAITIGKNAYGDKHQEVSRMYYNLGNIALKKGNYRHALKMYHVALSAGNVFFEDTSVYVHPPVKDFFDARTYPIIYMHKAESFYALFMHNGNIKDLQFALEAYQKCDTLADMLRRSHIKHADDIIVNKENRNVYEGAIAASLLFYKRSKDSFYHHQAFHFSERSKSMALNQALSEVSARNLGNVPIEILSLERNLKTDIAN